MLAVCRGPSRARRIVLRILAACIALYGAYAFVSHSIPDYLFLRSQFVFFDFDEPLVFFFLDVPAAMGLFAAAGHYLARVLRLRRKAAG